MKKISFIKFLSVVLLAATSLCACNSEEDHEDYEEIYGSGSPLAENVVPTRNLMYNYNEEGLVTKIRWIGSMGETIDVAEISYPQSDRAVMTYTKDALRTTYVFAFGENHFANRVIEMDADGETRMTKFAYDNDGHVTSIKGDEDVLKMEWTNGNLTKISQDEYNASTVITYGDKTNFSTYRLSPFLIGVDLGPYMSTMEWWYERGLEYALYIGFFGKPLKNLPETMTCYDSKNKTPEQRTFVYTYNEEFNWGKWEFSIN